MNRFFNDLKWFIWKLLGKVDKYVWWECGDCSQTFKSHCAYSEHVDRNHRVSLNPLFMYLRY